MFKKGVKFKKKDHETKYLMQQPGETGTHVFAGILLVPLRLRFKLKFLSQTKWEIKFLESKSKISPNE